MAGRLGMIGSSLARGDSLVEKAIPKRLPFLHPKARPFEANQAFARQEGNSVRHKLWRKATFDNDAEASIKHIKTTVSGPHAPQKVLDSLSGQDYQDTLGKLGRATRRQNKEFSAVVHPWSGRVIAMNRGGQASASISNAKVMERHSNLIRLAARTKNPQIAERAMSTVQGTNPNTAGPKPVFVHNHPTQSAKDSINRHYPSTPDRTVVTTTAPGHRVVVLSHQPGERGSKQTKAVTSRMMPGRTINPKVEEKLNRQDISTMPPKLEPIAAKLSGASLDDLKDFKRKERRTALRVYHVDSKGQTEIHVRPYDQAHKDLTGSRKAAEHSGLYTTESMHKSLGFIFAKAQTTMSDAEAKRLAAQYDTVGPLPKNLKRDERMKAYEARYVAAGGKKATKWQKRADIAEVGRNVGLAGATVSAAALLASRGKRSGPAMARNKVLRHITPHRTESAALSSAIGGGWSELYGEHARSRASSYKHSPAGVAGSALTRMQAYTPKENS